MKKLLLSLIVIFSLVSCKKNDKENDKTYKVVITSDVSSPAYLDTNSKLGRVFFTTSPYEASFEMSGIQQVDVTAAYINGVDKSITIKLYQGSTLIESKTANKTARILYLP